MNFSGLSYAQKRLIIAVLTTVILCGSAGLAQAADALSTLPANTLYARFFEDLDAKISSAKIKTESAVVLYEDLDEDPVYTKYLAAQGSATAKSTNNKFLEGDLVVLSETTVGKKVGSIKMNAITKENDVFIQFANPSNKKLKKQWFKVPYEKYESLGVALEESDLFDAGVIEELSPVEAEAMTQSIFLAKKHSLYLLLPETIDDGYKVANAKRFNLVLNPDAIAPFFNELSGTLDAETRAKSVFALEGFEENLINRSFTDYIADHTYVSLWFDERSSLPVRYLQILTLPPTGSRTETAVLVQDFKIESLNKAVNVKAPAKFKSLEELIAILGIKLDGVSDKSQAVIDPARKELLALLDKYALTSKKADKAHLAYRIAQEYDGLAESDNAATFYKTAASLYRKNSVDYYEALAQAEWSLKNGKGAKDYFEQALRKDPNSIFTLDNYGYFLLGITGTTFSLQDVNYAFKLNKRLLGLYPSDNVLINLYLNYVLLGDVISAEALIPRFTKFATGDNYHVIARAYHRLGNKEREAHYLKLARDMGYVQDARDKEFFALNF